MTPQKYYIKVKNFFSLKKRSALKTSMIALVIIAVLAMIIVPRHIKNSRNQAAINMLQQIALAEIASQVEACNVEYLNANSACFAECHHYVFTDGVIETAEESVTELAEYGFRPNPSVAFHIMPQAAINSEPMDRSDGFVAFVAHNSVGSTVYVYDNIRGDGVRQARENDLSEGYGGVTAASSMLELFCYTYDPSNSGAPVVKKANGTKIAPDSKDKSPARLVVVEAAK